MPKDERKALIATLAAELARLRPKPYAARMAS